MAEALNRLIALVGPTGTGKSELALALGQHLGGPAAAEMIGADALQFYRGMDIGTAKLTEPERRGFVHHQIDTLEITETASVVDYQQSAREDVLDVWARGKAAIAVGGSGLYLRALLDKLEFPGTDTEVRTRLETELEECGSHSLHRRLNSLDPVSGERINPANGRRIVRALEVIALTGRPYSASLPDYQYWRPTIQIGLRGDLSALDQRIAERSTRMFQQGLVDEVKSLVEKGLLDGRTAKKATGYPEALSVLAGEISVTEGISAVSQATSRLVRKQMKWFKRDPRIHWIDFESDSVLEDTRKIMESETEI